MCPKAHPFLYLQRITFNDLDVLFGEVVVTFISNFTSFYCFTLIIIKKSFKERNLLRILVTLAIGLGQHIPRHIKI